MYFVLEVALGPGMKLAGWKMLNRSAPLSPHPKNPTPAVVYFTERSKTIVPVEVLIFVVYGLLYEAICFKSCLVLFSSYVFSFLPLRLPRFGKRELKLSALCTVA